MNSYGREIFSLARIHNNEASQESLKSEELISRLLENNSLTCNSFDISEQPLLVTLDRFSKPRKTLIARRSRQRRLELNWALYLREKVGFYRKSRSVIGQILYVFKISLSKSALSEELRVMQIEQLVTAKHLSAFRLVTGGGLIVLESDAAIHENSPRQLDMTIKILSKNRDNNLYFNIAGGLRYTEIGIHRLASKFSESMDIFEIPVSNTSCAYAVTETFVRKFVTYIDAKVDVLDFGIDWVFNSFFLNRGDEVICIHANPPALSHGSFTGKSESWNPKNRAH